MDVQILYVCLNHWQEETEKKNIKPVRETIVGRKRANQNRLICDALEGGFSRVKSFGNGIKVV